MSDAEDPYRLRLWAEYGLRVGTIATEETDGREGIAQSPESEIAATFTRLGVSAAIAKTTSTAQVVGQGGLPDRPLMAARRLPPEILRLIFRQLHPVPVLLESALANNFCRHVWLETSRTTKNVAAVCRDWRDAGTEFLYEIVLIRQVGQLCALTQTLYLADSRGDDLARFITHLVLDFHVPSGYGQLALRELNSLVERCHRLESVSCNPGFYSQDRPLKVHSLDWYPPVAAANLRHLRIRSTAASGPVDISFLRACPNLVSLGLTNVGAPISAIFPETCLGIRFVHLQNLSLQVGKDWMYSVMHWDMPRLQQLSIEVTDGQGVLPPDIWKVFLSKHGRNLKYLESGSAIKTWNVVQGLVDLCPVLEHLCIREPPGPPFAIEHRRLRFIDFWTTSPGSAVSPRPGPRLGLPCLVRMRLIDIVLKEFPGLPLLLHPGDNPRLPGQALRSFPFSGVTLRTLLGVKLYELNGVLMRYDFLALANNREWGSESEEDDPSFVPDESDDDSDGTSSFYDSDEFSEEDPSQDSETEEQAGCDRALEAFRASLVSRGPSAPDV